MGRFCTAAIHRGTIVPLARLLLLRWSPLLAVVSLAIAACSGGSGEKTLVISGIPDQDVSVLEARFNKMAQYLTEKTGVRTRYQPTVDYAAVVTGFKNGDIQLAFFGGLTGVQARLAVPGAQAIAQRDIDPNFTSVFIAQKGLGVNTLQDLKGKTFTFGSASSTSGYTMPLYFLAEAGINPDKDFAAVNYSGSHDKTWKLVESGSFQAGVLNGNVWDTRVKEGAVDLSRVEAFWRTPTYYDYHWVVRPDAEKVFGNGFTEKVTKAILAIDGSTGGLHQEIMKAFQATRFIPTKNDNYRALEAVARQLGLIER